MENNRLNDGSFSIVIPLYNKEHHVQRAIKSVLNQTVQDFELIIVDDGSNDGSFEAASAIHDACIRIIRQENFGVSAARNRGIMEAKHDWVAFLDADDEWLPGFLEEIARLIKIFPQCTVAGTGYYQLDPGKEMFVNAISVPIELGWKGILENYFEVIGKGNPFNSSSFAARKAALIKAGLYPEGVSKSEDSSLYLRLAIDQVIGYSYTPLSIYHREAGNRTWKGFGTEELHVVKVGKEILASGNLDQTSKDGIYEYLVRVELGRVRALLYLGKSKEARKVLDFCLQSKRNSGTVEKLLRWTQRPKFFYRLLYAVKDRTKQFLQLLDKTDMDKVI